jgi:hypothetical protein
MAQGVLNFSVEATHERLTPRAGEIVFGEYLKAIALDKLVDLYLPHPKSNRGYAPYRFIQPLLLMLHSGGKSLDDIRMIREDRAMRTLLKMPNIPTADAIGKWLKRHGTSGTDGMRKINKRLLKLHLKHIDEPLVLDIDASVIESHKESAHYTYKMIPGYTPMLGHINGGYIIHSEFREGNVAPADRNLDFVKQSVMQLAKGYQLNYLRADAASYQHRLFDYCEDHGVVYTIGAHLDSRVLESIQEIKQWKTLKTVDGKEHHLKEEVAEFVHTMNESKKAFRLIVVKKQITPILPTMEDTFTQDEKLHYAREHYSVIATNSEEMSAQEVVTFYRQRGDSSENRIKELKNGFNMKYLPTSNFEANAFYFQIGTLAYNLFVLFKETLQQSWQRHTIQTLRYKLYNIAGKVITHARETILKVNEQFVEILNSIRQKSYEVSLQ